jgi:hypothetical protein
MCITSNPAGEESIRDMLQRFARAFTHRRRLGPGNEAGIFAMLMQGASGD